MKKKHAQPDWKSVPVKVTGDRTNASRLLGEALVKFLSAKQVRG